MLNEAAPLKGTVADVGDTLISRVLLGVAVTATLPVAPGAVIVTVAVESPLLRTGTLVGLATRLQLPPPPPPGVGLGVGVGVGVGVTVGDGVGVAVGVGVGGGVGG